jgi:hypothetical protein
MVGVQVGRLGEFPDQAGLADTRLAGDQEQLGQAARRAAIRG